MKAYCTLRVVWKNPTLSQCVFEVQCTIKLCVYIRLHNQSCILEYLGCIYFLRNDSRRPQQSCWSAQIVLFLCVFFLSTTMSAESPRKTSRQSGHVVTPQPVSDRSIIESVAGFINEVVPQVIGFLLYLYSSLSFTHNLGLSHRSWLHYPIILCSLHTVVLVLRVECGNECEHQLQQCCVHSFEKWIFIF